MKKIRQLLESRIEKNLYKHLVKASQRYHVANLQLSMTDTEQQHQRYIKHRTRAVKDIDEILKALANPNRGYADKFKQILDSVIINVHAKSGWKDGAKISSPELNYYVIRNILTDSYNYGLAETLAKNYSDVSKGKLQNQIFTQTDDYVPEKTMLTPTISSEYSSLDLLDKFRNENQSLYFSPPAPANVECDVDVSQQNKSVSASPINPQKPESPYSSMALIHRFMTEEQEKATYSSVPPRRNSDEAQSQTTEQQSGKKTQRPKRLPPTPRIKHIPTNTSGIMPSESTVTGKIKFFEGIAQPTPFAGSPKVTKMKSLQEDASNDPAVPGSRLPPNPSSSSK